jgi:hypothetical protein
MSRMAARPLTTLPSSRMNSASAVHIAASVSRSPLLNASLNAWICLRMAASSPLAADPEGRGFSFGSAARVAFLSSPFCIAAPARQARLPASKAAAMLAPITHLLFMTCSPVRSAGTSSDPGEMI